LDILIIYFIFLQKIEPKCLSNQRTMKTNEHMVKTPKMKAINELEGPNEGSNRFELYEKFLVNYKSNIMFIKSFKI